jgi:hypothetical protein
VAVETDPDGAVSDMSVSLTLDPGARRAAMAALPRPPYRDRRMLKTRSGRTLLLGVLILMVLPGGGFYLGGHSTLGAVFFLGCAAGAALFRFFAVPYWIGRSQAESAGYPLGRETLHIGLGPSGIRIQGDTMRSWYDWAAIGAVTEGKTGIGLWLTRDSAIAVPDAALPEAMTRADFLHRIRDWQTE